MGWYAGGDTVLTMADGKVFHLGSVSAVVMQTLWRATGALVTGRRDFDVSAAWGGTHPLNVPAFIVTHTPPPDWATRRSPFTFVTDGVASAIAQAKATAGERHVLVNGSRIAQQSLQAGLVDELQIELVPVVLGQGIRLFDHLGPAPIALACTAVDTGTAVTHLRYRVVRDATT